MMRKLFIALLPVVLIPVGMYGYKLLWWSGLEFWVRGADRAAEHLVEAASLGVRKEVDRVLRSRRVGADAANRHGLTALMGAVIHGSDDLATRLLDKGAQVNAVVRDGSPAHPPGTTALMLAAQRGNWHMTSLLLDRGANPNQRVTGGESVGHTALCMAVHAESVGPITTLLQHRADPRVRARGPDGHSHSPLGIALSRGQLEIAEILARRGASVDDVVSEGPWQGMTDLMVLVKQGHGLERRVIRWAVRRSAKPEFATPSVECPQCTVLMLAASLRNRAAVAELLDRGAMVRAAEAIDAARRAGDDAIANDIEAYLARCGQGQCAPPSVPRG